MYRFFLGVIGKGPKMSVANQTHGASTGHGPEWCPWPLAGDLDSSTDIAAGNPAIDIPSDSHPVEMLEEPPSGLFDPKVSGEEALVHVLQHILPNLLWYQDLKVCSSTVSYETSVNVHLPSERSYPSCSNKNIDRHTAHTIVSWPCPKQGVIVHSSDLMMIRQSIYILSIITREIGKLKTHSPIYCIMDNWEYA